MTKSSKKEDPTYRNMIFKIFTKLQKVFLSFKFSPTMLYGKVKKQDDFFAAIKQLEVNSRKMSADERNILTNLIKLEGKTVEDIIVPRSDIAAIKLTASMDELNHIIRTNLPHTRTLVYEETLDNIIGFVHIKDLFKALIIKQKFQLKRLIRKHIIAAPSMKLIDLLAKMRRERTHIAIVVDEYGGTDGMVTIEDVMEAIVGKIEDEHDRKSINNDFKILDDHTIVANSRVEVEVLEEIIGVQLKSRDDEFDTIGGLVLAQVGNVPEIGTKVTISQDIEIEVTGATPRALKEVKIRLAYKLSEKVFGSIKE